MDFRELDASFMNYLEFGPGKAEIQFARVDADVSALSEESEEGKELDAGKLQELFRKALDNEELEVTLAPMADEKLIAVVTEDEQSRRFRELYRMKDMPERYDLVLNRRSPTVQALAARDPEDDLTLLLCEQIYDLARMAARPLEADQVTAFLTRSQELLGKLV